MEPCCRNVGLLLKYIAVFRLQLLGLVSPYSVPVCGSDDHSPYFGTIH
jgi:hypothetical protein